jgi:hypothetical protein
VIILARSPVRSVPAHKNGDWLDAASPGEERLRAAIRESDLMPSISPKWTGEEKTASLRFLGFEDPEGNRSLAVFDLIADNPVFPVAVRKGAVISVRLPTLARWRFAF